MTRTKNSFEDISSRLLRDLREDEILSGINLIPKILSPKRISPRRVRDKRVHEVQGTKFNEPMAALDVGPIFLNLLMLILASNLDINLTEPGVLKST